MFAPLNATNSDSIYALCVPSPDLQCIKIDHVLLILAASAYCVSTYVRTIISTDCTYKQ